MLCVCRGYVVKMNLKALSQSLGLSQTTVSRALAGYSDVSATTRQRVVEAARLAGYQPDATARRLATGRADAVGIVYPFGASGLGDPRFVDVVAGISDGLSEAGLDLIIAAARPHSELDTYQRLINNRRVDALIVASTLQDDPRIRFLQDSGFPFLAYGRTLSPVPYAWFDFDNQAGARMAAQRLINLGHRRIALIHAPLSINFAAQRHAGFCEALRAAGMAPDPALMCETPLSRKDGYEAMRRLLALDPRPTAVLVDNNLSGIGALRALTDAGLIPGRDVSLIIYDGISSDIPLPYRVTAVTQPTGDSSGRAIARLVVDVLAGKPLDSLQQLGQPEIEPGDTDGPPARQHIAFA